MMDIAHIHQIHNQSSLAGVEAMRRRLDATEGLHTEMCPEEKAAIREAAETFESYFIQIMLREMRKTIPDEGGLIPRSQAERIFTEMLDEQKSIEMARAGGIGLADVIVKQLTRDSYLSNMR